MTAGRPAAAPRPEADTVHPRPARVYDHLLGGKDNFAADRALAEEIQAAVPSARTAARENRAFLFRAVRYLAAEAGIRQFIDIGTGLPAAGSVHETAQRADPSSRVVYADNDPQVIAHARALLTGSPEGRIGCALADLRDPDTVLASPVVRDVIDFTQPAALLLTGVLHCLLDEDQPGRVIAELLAALPAGSYLAASHLSAEHDPGGWAAAGRAYREAGLPAQFRDSDDFTRLAFTGLDLVPPGAVLVSEWRPGETGPRPAPAEVSTYGAVARKC
jgi:hypothetical protein